MTFHNKLGTQAELYRADRSAGARDRPDGGRRCRSRPHEAARVAKADLQSEMVGEFPELARADGPLLRAGRGPCPTPWQRPAKEHYAPLGPSDDVPTAPVSVAVALADKIDTLTGFWAIDEKPTGSKDPFALRRAALGVIRLRVGRTQIRIVCILKLSLSVGSPLL